MINSMTHKKTARELGRWGEGIARSFLQEKGYEVIDQNVFTAYGEIDLVLKKSGRVHFVEVKTRRSKKFGHPEEAITPRKFGHMIDSAHAYLQTNPEYDGEWQIDVIAIQAMPYNHPPQIRFFENVQ